jgi:hypothetical protein
MDANDENKEQYRPSFIQKLNINDHNEIFQRKQLNNMDRNRNYAELNKIQQSTP